MNLGTPDSPSVPDVRRYLREFLADPFVIKLPRGCGWLTPALSALIAQFRGPRSAHAYQAIWWPAGSPLKVITERQSAGLADRLGGDWSVYYAMRYANPSIRDVVARMVADGVTEVVVVPMYPQHAGPTTGTAMEVLYRELRRAGLRLAVTVRSDWCDDHGYIEAQANLIHGRIAELGLTHRDAFLLFSTHSMPTSYIKNGDPYEGQIRRSMELVLRRLGWPQDRTALSFQSKLGPVPWLAPATEDSLVELAEQGERDVVVCPISFTADCLETLEEVGIGYAKLFQERSGGGRLHLLPALNDDDMFIDALARLVRRGPQRMSPDSPVTPLRASSEREPLSSLIDRLVMVGVSTPGRLERCETTGVVDEQELRALSRERRDILETVRACDREANIDGCVALNTCQRSELYALAERGSDPEDAASRLRRHFFAGGAVQPIALRGQDAYRRLLSNAVGLNSALPGDTDVAEQVRSAARMAEHAGALSAGLRRLFEDARRLASTVREETRWSEFSHDFAAAAMSALGLTIDPHADCVIIGGSTTSRQLLRAMAADGASDRLTLAYRGGGRKDLVQFVRRVAPHARRLRVGRYDDPQVLKAIGSADVVFVGVDSREPTLRREHLDGVRDFTVRPLMVIDFNSHGSTDSLESLAGVALVTADRLGAAASQFGAEMIQRPGFEEALGQARRYVEAACRGRPWSAQRRPCAAGSCGNCQSMRPAERTDKRVGAAAATEGAICQPSP